MLNNTITKNHYDDVLTAYSSYPSPIRPYLLKADTNPFLRSIFTKDGMRILIDIVARASIRDCSRAIKLRVDRVANDTGLSEKTVQRVLRLLEGRKWLSRSPSCDGRNYRGRFSGREFLIGDALRVMMGLSTKSVDNSTNGTELSDGVYVNKKEDFLKEEGEGKPESGVPRGLLELQHALDLSKGGVCALMALAKKQGKWLQDIWENKKNSILKAGITQGRAFCYIKSIILNPKKFKKVSVEKKNCHIGNISPEKTDNRHLWHKRYTGPNGVTVKIFDGTAEVMVRFGEYRFIPASDMQSIYEAIRHGKLNLVLE